MTPPKPHRRKQILVCGHWLAEEQQGVRAFLEERRRRGDATARVVELHERPQASEFVDLVIVCLSHPDEYPPATIQRLWDDYPLSQFVCSASQFCVSEPRTRGLWPVAWRVAAEDVRKRLESIWSERFRQPMTASREEVLIAELE